MQSVLASTRGCTAAQRSVYKIRTSAGRRSFACKAEIDTKASPTQVNSVPSSASKIAIPEWVPEQAAPVVEFLDSESFKLQESSFYKTYLQTYLENEYFVQFTGFKKDPETINGRAAMIGFLAAAGAEIFGSGSFLQQLSKFPQPVLVVLVLITVGSVVPVVKGTKGDYLSSLRDQYTLPDGWFTENLERVHGRLAMLGLSGLIAIELVKGSAVL